MGQQVPDLSNYATKYYVDSKKPDLSGYATKTDVSTYVDSKKPDLSGYAKTLDIQSTTIWCADGNMCNVNKTLDFADSSKLKIASVPINKYVTDKINAANINEDNVINTLSSRVDFAKNVGDALRQNQLGQLSPDIQASIADTLMKNQGFRAQVTGPMGPAGTITANSGFTVTGQDPSSKDGYPVQFVNSNHTMRYTENPYYGLNLKSGNQELVISDKYGVAIKNNSTGFTHFNHNNTDVNYIRGTQTNVDGKFCVKDWCLDQHPTNGNLIFTSKLPNKGYYELARVEEPNKGRWVNWG